MHMCDSASVVTMIIALAADSPPRKIMHGEPVVAQGVSVDAQHVEVRRHLREPEATPAGEQDRHDRQVQQPAE